MESLRPPLRGQSRHPMSRSQPSNTDPISAQGRHPRGDFNYGQPAEAGRPGGGRSELPHPRGRSGLGSRDRGLPGRPSPQTPASSVERTLPHCPHRSASPPMLRKTRGQPPACRMGHSFKTSGLFYSSALGDFKHIKARKSKASCYKFISTPQVLSAGRGKTKIQ